MALSRSTPGYRFDVAAPPAPAPAAPGSVDPQAEVEVEALLADPAQPLVMFGLEWCEFCWSVRKVFAQRGIAFVAIDLDSVAYQAGDRGGRIREALRRRTGSQTLPQIFVGGAFAGGCTDVFDSLRSGDLQHLLQRHGVAYDRKVTADPYALLPRWLHPR